MIKRLAVAFIAGALTLAIFVPSVSAHATKWGCTNPVGFAYFYGDSGFYPSSHYLQLCSSGISNLDLIDTNEGYGTCTGFLGGDDGHWDNCITSVYVSFYKSGYHLCLYNNTNYSTSGGALDVRVNWSSSNLSSAYNDKFSSMRWRSTSYSC